ncbi:uncharacterized protein LOC142777493 isoform X2 [Rhipicephalus microplus]|uniref:uncharacterized protein LOC142777493 isoform X2 n=1 Tax=Rhipicephalus microplus TaxID=6941 RepID=UPI003F6C5F68
MWLKMLDTEQWKAAPSVKSGSRSMCLNCRHRKAMRMKMRARGNEKSRNALKQACVRGKRRCKGHCPRICVSATRIASNISMMRLFSISSPCSLTWSEIQIPHGVRLNALCVKTTVGI